MTYGLVALGGALGSVLRYWLGLLSVAALGSGFPWGTIVINVGGSFLIGLVGAATVADGLLPTGPAARIFLMVGFCGGFTTFSSFSLQTLDLVRDGRLVAGLLNVVLSVVLCFAAVAAGHYAAVGLGGRRMADARGAGSRPHAVLAVLEQPARVEAQLDAAAWLSGLYHPEAGGRIAALVVRARPRDTDMPTEQVMAAEQAPAMRASERTRALRIKSEVDRWAASHRTRLVDWSEPEGLVGGLVRQAGREADLIVLAQAGDAAREALHAALFETARPVLMIPGSAGPPNGPGLARVAAIAWKDDRAANRAVRAALPLLRRMARLVLLADPPLQAVPAIFLEQGLAVELGSVGRGAAELGERLLRAAEASGADLLVMGAFAHSPFRERILGGVTRHVLEAAMVPVLMQH